MRPRPVTPLGNGEVVVDPPVETWAAMAAEASATAARWDFLIGGCTAQQLRCEARADVMNAAAILDARGGLEINAAWDESRPLVVTGHQPEFYHTGVWAKPLLAQRAAEQIGGTALDLAVDSDGFDTIGVVVPCMRPAIQRCRHVLAVGTSGCVYADTSVPSPEDIGEFCESVHASLATLPAPAVARHFSEFCVALETARTRATDLAELIVFARRFHERPVHVPYSQVMVTKVAATPSFRRFAADLIVRAAEVRDAHNAALGQYRQDNGVRSAAQPFPDLGEVGGGIELPLWFVADGRRTAVGAVRTTDHVDLVAGDTTIATLSLDALEAAEGLAGLAGVLAPRAATLTLFTRMFVADVFIHGIGGARYDRVTDMFAERLYGIAPPPFATVSMTLYLPLGMHVVGDDELEQVRQRAHRLKHNPDQLIDEVEFDTPEQQHRAQELAGRKSQLVADIAAPGADRKAVGLEIRAVNAEFAALLSPLAHSLEERVAHLEAERAASDVLTDRTYPFCLFGPFDVIDRLG